MLVALPIRVDEMQVYAVYEAMAWNLDEFFMELLPYIVRPSQFNPDTLHDLTLVQEFKDQPVLYDQFSIMSICLEIEFMVDYLSQSLRNLLPHKASRQFNTVWYERPDTLCFFKTEASDLE